MTRRRFIADQWTSTSATLTGDQAEHLARVLRAAPGQIYDVVAGGFLHRAEITRVAPGLVEFALHEELQSDDVLPLHLLLAVFKFDHMEWALEKATELGVARITPVLAARRSEKHLQQAAAKRAERWRRIALESAKQSRRSSVPEIRDPVQLRPALELETSPVRLLLSETEQGNTLARALSSNPNTSPNTGQPPDHTRPITHALAIGPEGGWTPEEMQTFAALGWQSVTLGPRILQHETAAVAAIAILGALLPRPDSTAGPEPTSPPAA